MTKYLTATTVTVHGIDDPQVFTDTAEYTGGSAVASMAKAGKDIKVKDTEGKEIIIPWHAVMMVTIEHSTADGADPEDTFCAESEGGELIPVDDSFES